MKYFFEIFRYFKIFLREIQIRNRRIFNIPGRLWEKQGQNTKIISEKYLEYPV